MKLGIVGLSILTFWCQRSQDPWTKVCWEYNLTQSMKVYFFAWAISLSWNFWSIFKTLDCRVGPLDFFEGSSSPGLILTGQVPSWGLPQQFGTIFWSYLMKLGIVGLSILTYWCQRSQDPWTKVRWEYNLTQNMKVYFLLHGPSPWVGIFDLSAKPWIVGQDRWTFLRGPAVQVLVHFSKNFNFSFS